MLSQCYVISFVSAIHPLALRPLSTSLSASEIRRRRTCSRASFARLTQTKPITQLVISFQPGKDRV